MSNRHDFNDFTHDAYRRMLALAKKHYTFCSYRNFEREKRFILWRHDVDYSMHAAAELARIEADAGVQATYFLLPGCEFYNLFEPSVKKCMGDIRALGHAFGLHFDLSAHAVHSPDDLEASLAKERRLLEDYCGQEISAFSFHNPDEAAFSFHTRDYAGMVNAYARYFREEIGYCSDSNGIWRHQRLEDVLKESPPRLQVLTHPAWWTEKPMSPRARIFRCIDGRGRAVFSGYNRQLADDGRENVFELEAEFAVLDELLGDRALTLQMTWLRGEREGVFLELWRRFGQGGDEKWRKAADALMRGEHMEDAVLQEGIAHIVQLCVQQEARQRAGLMAKRDKIILTPMRRESLETQLAQALAMEQASGLNPQWKEENFLVDLPEKWQHSCWIMLDGHCIGYAILSRKTAHNLHLHRLVVTPTGKGYGSAAMRLLMENLSGYSPNITTMAGTERAMQFYERLGFLPIFPLDGGILFFRRAV